MVLLNGIFVFSSGQGAENTLWCLLKCVKAGSLLYTLGAFTLDIYIARVVKFIS